MHVTFLHTADWQLGKPFAGVEDAAKRALLQNERFRAVERIGELARERGAKFVLVAGDLFDSPRPTQATVAAACSAIGAIPVPVYAIPGNHDHGGAGSLWEEPFFRRESARLSPNLKVLLQETPHPVEDAVLLPCPLVRRQAALDPSGWLRPRALYASLLEHLPRLVLAHGSTQNFGPADEDDEEVGPAGQPNLIDLANLPAGEVDYVALGDWHGTRQVDASAWYSGTPETDRFLRGGDHDPGNVLVVRARRGVPPLVEKVRVGGIGWHDLEFEFLAGAGPGQLAERVQPLVGNRANRDLLRLCLRGSLSLEEMRQLDEWIQTWEARLIRVKLTREIALAPTEAERLSLARRTGDPLLARVAEQLMARSQGTDPDAEIARIALRELYVALQNP